MERLERERAERTKQMEETGERTESDLEQTQILM